MAASVISLMDGMPSGPWSRSNSYAMWPLAKIPETEAGIIIIYPGSMSQRAKASPISSIPPDLGLPGYNFLRKRNSKSVIQTTF